MSRDLARHLAGLAGGMRTAHPDLEAHQLVEIVNGLGMVTRPDWPEGQVIGVPFAGHATDSGIGACDVGFQFGSRQHPFIFGGMTRTFGDIKKAAVVITALGQWHQSNYSSGQNAVGGPVDPAKYLMDPAAVTSWPLPTSDDSGITHAGLKAYGLVQYTDGTTEIYATMWPRKRESDGKIQVCAGAWNAASKAVIWENISGSYDIPADEFENQLYPMFNLFHTAVGNWIFMIPSTAFSNGWQYGNIYSTRVELPNVVISSLAFTTEAANASIHAWTDVVAEVSTNKFYLFLPFFLPGPVVDAEIHFMALNETTGYWAHGATRSIATIPVGGEALVPDLIGVGNVDSAKGPPAAWLGKEALIFVSGGTKDILDATKWQDWNWTLRSLKPADGTDGALVKSKSVTAVNNPPLLNPGSMKAAVAAQDYPLVAELGFPPYVTGWTGGITYSEDTQSAYAHFKRVVPIILPVAAPNLGRLGTIESRMANDHSDNPQWPLVVENSGGGPVVDEAGTVWTVIMEPEQCLYGGYYTAEDTGTTHVGYTWSSRVIFYALNESGSTIIVSVVDGLLHSAGDPPYFYGAIPGAGTCYSNYILGEGQGAPEGPPDNPPENPYGAHGASIAAYLNLVYTEYSPLFIWRWNQYHGCKWRTMLRGHKSNGSTIEKDISQKIDATTTINLGKPISTPVAQTQIDMELGDNVWQMISFADKNLLAILRDLHADGAGNNPSPAIEIWQIGSTSATKLSITRLGSYTEVLAVDATLGSYETLAGDQEWDPYAYGPPRMKACRKAGTSNTPVIVAMVGENKKVDPATQSQFKRVCYATIELSTSASPDVVRSARTSEDLGVGSSGEPTGTDFHGPIWDSWDTLVLTPAGVAWIVDSEFRETTA